jgi:hypothetical protein
MGRARYEVRVSGTLSERARCAFSAMDVRSVPPQTIVFGELADQSDLRDLLTLCSTMGLEVVSVRRLTAEAPVGRQPTREVPPENEEPAPA